MHYKLRTMNNKPFFLFTLLSVTRHQIQQIAVLQSYTPVTEVFVPSLPVTIISN